MKEKTRWGDKNEGKGFWGLEKRLEGKIGTKRLGGLEKRMGVKRRRNGMCRGFSNWEKRGQETKKYQFGVSKKAKTGNEIYSP